ncbi:MAG: RNA-binding S4 domain-containing protein [Pyrinomonadaceae bacterium]
MRIENIMRLDLFLKASRLVPRRTLAQKFCDAGRVMVNGSQAKSSHSVKVGDEVVIRCGDKETTIGVAAVPSSRQTSRKEATELYEIIGEKLFENVD